MNASTFKTTLLCAAASGALALGLGMPATSHATTTAMGGASALCKASSGPGANVFFFSALGATNTSNATQFLTCHVPMIGNSSGADSSLIFLHMGNPTAVARTITCVVVSHHFGTTSEAAAVYNFNVAAGNDHFFESLTPSSTPALPARGADAYYVLSCSIPPGTRLVSIRADWPGTIAP